MSSRDLSGLGFVSSDWLLDWSDNHITRGRPGDNVHMLIPILVFGSSRKGEVFHLICVVMKQHESQSH